MLKGRDTRVLAEALPGNEFLVTGSVGNYFKPIKDSKITLIASGIGLALMINATKRDFSSIKVCKELN